MSYNIAFKKSVARDIRKIGMDEVKSIMQKIEEDLPCKAATCPSLAGKFSGLRKFRIGYFRVIFTIIDNTVLVLRITHRREAYR